MKHAAVVPLFAQACGLALALSLAPGAFAQGASQGTAPAGSGPATIAPASTDAALAHASQLIQNGQPALACQVLAKLTVSAKQEPVRLYLLSHCLSATGNIALAAAVMQRVANLLPNAGVPRAELSGLYLKQGRPDLARQAAIEAAQRQTAPGVRADLNRLVQQIDGDPAAQARANVQAKPWRVNLFTGLVYDTNINGGPNSSTVPVTINGVSDTVRLGADARPKHAWGAMESLSGSYYQPLGSRLSLLYQAGVDRTDYFNESRYRNDALALAATLGYQGDHYSLSLQPSYRYYRQADQQQETDMGLTAAVVRQLTQRWSVTGSVGYTNRRFEQDDRQDANGVSASIGTRFLLTPQVLVGANYLLGRERAREAMFSRRLHGPSAYATWQASSTLSITASYQYLDSTYDEPMPYILDARHDRQQTAGLTATWDISRYTHHDMAVRLQYLYSTTPSNVALYDYDRQMALLGLEFHF